MRKEKIEQLRENINKMISSDNYDYNELLEKSRELDKLILKAMKKKASPNSVPEEEP